MASGIHNFAIDPSQNKVSITGDAEAGVIIKKFLKSNKQVELWPEKSKLTNANAKTSGEKNQSKEINTSNDLSENKKPDEIFKEKKKTVDAEAPSKSDNGPEKSPNENGPKTQRGSAVADVDDSSKKYENQEVKSGGDKKKEKMAQKETNGASSGTVESSATEDGDSSGDKKKEKMVVQKETNSAGSGVESSSATEGTTSLPPPLQQQLQNMTYQTPTAAYVMSYNMAQPSTAHSYYAFPATPPSPPPSQGYFYSSYAPPPPPPPPEFFHGVPSEWGSPAPPPESYHMFNDENANSCDVM